MARPVRTDLKTTLNEVGQVASIQQRSCTSGLIPHIRAAELFADHEDSGGEPTTLRMGAAISTTVRYPSSNARQTRPAPVPLRCASTSSRIATPRKPRRDNKRMCRRNRSGLTHTWYGSCASSSTEWYMMVNDGRLVVTGALRARGWRCKPMVMYGSLPVFLVHGDAHRDLRYVVRRRQ